MIVFCPNCGTQNPGIPGTRATCTACSSTFEVPADAGGGPRTPAAAPPPPAREPAPPPAAPGAQSFSSGPVVAAGGRRKTNTLAIVSLVAGIVCCVPFVSPGLAIGCGLGALKQLEAGRDAEAGRGLAIAGVILGSLTALVQLLGLIGSVSRNF